MADKPKVEAIDVYVRPFDRFPQRESYEITADKNVKRLLKKYNTLLQ